MKTQLLSAILTPLKPDDSLHTEGLQRHVDEQWKAGLQGIVVGGATGLMPLLPDRTYRDLIGNSVKFTAGRGELLIGVGDTSFVRTRDRLEFVQRLDVDGVMVLTPGFVKYTTEQLLDYYRALADFSRKPLYVCHAPQLTGVTLSLDTILQLAEHPNIRGMACCHDFALTRLLMDTLGEPFRVFVSQPTFLDHLLRGGVGQHVDGFFALAPRWAVSIARAIDQKDLATATEYQGRLNRLVRLLTERYLLFPAATAILNARGTNGKMAPAPISPLGEAERQQLLAEPIVAELLASK